MKNCFYCEDCKFWKGEYTGLSKRICIKYNESMYNDDGCGMFEEDK